MTVISLILSVLVVPKDRIWTVTYDLDGNITESPNPVPRISYYIDKSWKIGGEVTERTVWYYISHLEIVEIDVLNELIETHTKDDKYSLKKLYEYYLKTMEKK